MEWVSKVVPVIGSGTILYYTLTFFFLVFVTFLPILVSRREPPVEFCESMSLVRSKIAVQDIVIHFGIRTRIVL